MKLWFIWKLIPLPCLLLKAHFGNEAQMCFLKAKKFVNYNFFFLPNTKFRYYIFKKCILPF